MRFVINSLYTLSEPDGVDPVWIAVKRLLSPALTEAFVLGITGGSARRAHAPLLHSDLLFWLFPGLAMCGLTAALMPLPDTEEAWRTLLRQHHTRRSGGICLFAFSGDITPTPFSEPSYGDPTVFDSSKRSEPLEIQEQDPVVTASAFVTPLSSTADKPEKSGTMPLSEPDGALVMLDTRALHSRFSHALTLQKGGRRPAKEAAFTYAVRAWAQFACAYPARKISAAEADAPLRTLAAGFWRQMAGTGRSARSTRVRRLADTLAAPKGKRDLDAAFRSLYELACDSLLLPSYLTNALLAPDTAVLSDAERRELIYLARAGTRDVKIFAAYRLTFERECADARATLQQLRYDSDPWVRGVAQY